MTSHRIVGKPEPPMPLKAAAGQYRTGDGAPQRACEWYRKDAHRPGTVSIGGMPVIGICLTVTPR